MDNFAVITQLDDEHESLTQEETKEEEAKESEEETEKQEQENVQEDNKAEDLQEPMPATTENRKLVYTPKKSIQFSLNRSGFKPKTNRINTEEDNEEENEKTAADNWNLGF